MKIKYKQEIDDFLREIIYEDWLSDDEYDEIISESFVDMGVTMQQLSDNLEVGVKNGYTVESQLNILRKKWETI